MKFTAKDYFCRECGTHTRFFVANVTLCPNCVPRLKGVTATVPFFSVPLMGRRMLNRIYEMDVANELRRKIYAAGGKTKKELEDNKQ